MPEFSRVETPKTICTICGKDSIAMCRPYDAFISTGFGLFDGAGLLLCERCERLWATNYFGTIASNLHAQHNGVFRGLYVDLSTVYALVCQFEVMTRAKLN